MTVPGGVAADLAVVQAGLVLTRPGIIKDLIHRGGLNADILTDGQIRLVIGFAGQIAPLPLCQPSA